ncbi:MAG: hypothetical protein VB135_00440 [Burkholderia sp.]
MAEAIGLSTAGELENEQGATPRRRAALGNGSITHGELVEAGRQWLRRQKCSVILTEPFRSSIIQEQPDAIGWRDGSSILLEAKVSRADFLADFKKPWRLDPAKGVGDWRFYITRPGLINHGELPDRWGLVEFDGRRWTLGPGVPSNNSSWWERPFPEANKRNETQLLVSALGNPTFKPRPGTILRSGIDVEAWARLAAEDQETRQEAAPET